MRITLPEIHSSSTRTDITLQVQGEKTLRGVALGLILLLGAALRFSNLSAIGYGNTYYTAAVESMLQSWHNFFFVAAEPGGSVSVDKPPVGFWLQAISAHFLGVNGFAVVLPQLIAGMLSILVIYYLVRRSFGTFAGLMAALALSITPIVIATDRNNTIDSTLILTLLLAAWAFIKATETHRLRFLFLGAALVGIGFNIKMLEAYLPLPAFYALYLLGSSEKLLRKAGKLAITSILLLVISFSWAVAVDLTPSSQRPYVGSSSDNSELNLILGYNGVQRLLGMFGRRGAAPPAGSSQTPGILPGGGFPDGDDGFLSGSNNGGPFARTGGTGGQGGIFNIGQPGALRLFIAPLSKEMSWLLPFGILSGLLLAFRKRIRWPISPEHQALVLWGGWLATTGVFFSVAGFFHEYYLSTMGPPLATLVGIGAAGLWRLHKQRSWLAFSLLSAGAVATLAFQAYTALSYLKIVWWLPIVGVFVVGGILVLGAATLWKMQSTAIAGYSFILIGLLITPGIWSGLTTLKSTNTALPAAYGGQSSPGGFPGDQNGLQVNQTLLTYLEQNTQGMKYLLAVPSSHDGDGYILATGRPVLLMGGFSGSDPVVNGADLSRMVSEGELRYILLSRNGPGNQNSSVSAWVRSNCSLLSESSLSTGSFQGGFLGGFGVGALYDCAG